MSTAAAILESNPLALLAVSIGPRRRSRNNKIKWGT
jgi:hypothetical protein